MNRPKRCWWQIAGQKLKITWTFPSYQKLAEICRHEGIAPTLLYRWGQHLPSNAQVIQRYAGSSPVHAIAARRLTAVLSQPTPLMPCSPRPLL